MFGMGFFEILMIAVVAIIFLGPEKLPQALVDVAKFFRTIKRTMDDAKESLNKEINLAKIKEEALAYKNSITQGAQDLTKEFDLKTLDLEEDLTQENKKKDSDTSDTQAKATEKEPQNLPTKTIKPNRENQTTLHFGENLKQDSPKQTQKDSAEKE